MAMKIPQQLGPSPKLAPAPPRVLLAEDDDDMRHLVADALRRDGYFVIEAPDGARLRQFVDLLLRSGQADPRPELVITDVHMPGLSGLEVVEWLRELDWLTPVIVVTGFGDRETRQRAAELGVTTVLEKPIDLAALRRRVRELVPPDIPTTEDEPLEDTGVFATSRRSR